MINNHIEDEDVIIDTSKQNDNKELLLQEENNEVKEKDEDTNNVKKMNDNSAHELFNKYMAGFVNEFKNDYEKTIAEKDAALQAAQAALKNYHEKKDTLYVKLKSTIESQKEKITRINKKLTEKVNEVKDLKKSVQDVEQKLGDKDIALQATGEKINELNKNLTEKVNEVKNLEKNKNIYEMMIKEMRGEIEEKKAEIKEKKAVHKKMKVQIVELQEENEVHQKEKKVKEKLSEKEVDKVKDLMKILAGMKVSKETKQEQLLKDMMKKMQKKQLSKNDFAHQEPDHKHKEESEMIIDVVHGNPSLKRKRVE